MNFVVGQKFTINITGHKKPKLVDNDVWFAMNSWINCIDRFVSEDMELGWVNKKHFSEDLFTL